MKEMINLLDETIEILSKYNKTFDDVIAICGNHFQITKEDFLEYANTEYDGGFGSQEVAEDLIIIGDDFWLERWEYDGSEGWSFKTFPKYENLEFVKITALTVNQAKENGIDCSCGWETLNDLNGGKSIERKG